MASRDQDGEVVDVFLQQPLDGAEAKGFFIHIPKVCPNGPSTITIDKLRSYGVARRELNPDWDHDTSNYANNRAVLSDQPTNQGCCTLYAWI